MLISRDPCDRNLCRKNTAVSFSVPFTRFFYFRQHVFWDAHNLQKFIVPFLPAYIIQHSSRSIGDIGCMYLALGKLPDQPGIDCSECELSFLRFFSRARNILQYPPDFGSGEIGINNETCL